MTFRYTSFLHHIFSTYLSGYEEAKLPNLSHDRYRIQYRKPEELIMKNIKKRIRNRIDQATKVKTRLSALLDASRGLQALAPL